MTYDFLTPTGLAKMPYSVAEREGRVLVTMSIADLNAHEMDANRVCDLTRKVCNDYATEFGATPVTTVYDPIGGELLVMIARET